MHKTDPQPSTSQVKTRRPFLLKVLVVAFLLIAWFGSWRLVGVLREGIKLIEYLSVPLLVYLGFMGVVWGASGLASALSLWIGTAIAPGLARATAIGCFIWYWLDQIFLTQSEISQTSQPFMIAFSLLALAFALWVPGLPGTKNFIASKRK